MVIARKGQAPAGGAPNANQTSQAGNDGPPDDDAPDPKDDRGEDEQPDVAKCPNCGCEFDDDSGDVIKAGAKVEGGPQSDDYGAGSPKQAGGVDLDLPTPEPDAQAPIGTNAITQAVAAALAAGRR